MATVVAVVDRKGDSVTVGDAVVAIATMPQPDEFSSFADHEQLFVHQLWTEAFDFVAA